VTDRPDPHSVFSLTPEAFETEALRWFRYQATANPVYRDYIGALHIDPATVQVLEQIPFLPIRFFKTHRVISGAAAPRVVFESSGTTGQVPSRHYIDEPERYERSFRLGFERLYGPVSRWCILGLLPSYLEREHSSLVYMVDRLIRDSGHPDSGTFLHDLEGLAGLLQRLDACGQPVFLIGVTFGLLDLALAYPMRLRHTTIVETGGMKGRGAEPIRLQVHERLKEAFGVAAVHAEYGMTELLSQAWSDGGGTFRTPAWMRVLVREEEDPLAVTRSGSGALNIIDLANAGSCCFLATDDSGRVAADGAFEVTGRLDGSDLRGCSLLI
jgi:hypothetical protein